MPPGRGLPGAARWVRRVGVATAIAVVVTSVVAAQSAAAATAVTAVTFTSTAPTSLVANAPSTWTVGFTNTTALASAGTMTLTFPAGFATSSTTPTVTLVSPTGSDCAVAGSDSAKTNVVKLTLSNSGGTCSIPASSSVSVTVALYNGYAAAYGGANFSVATSKDTTVVDASSGETLTATSVTSVTVTSTAPTSHVELAASTWTWGFTTSSTGFLGAGDTITLTFPSGFTTISTTPTVALSSPSSFATTCTATATDTTETNVVVVTLANAASQTCLLGDSTAATLTVAVVNGTTDPLSSFSVATDEDAIATSPTGTAPTLTGANYPTAITFTTPAPTSLEANAASTWTVGFSTSSAGALAAGSYVAIQFPAGFTTSTTTPTVALSTPSSFAADCTASGSDPTKGDLVVVTLANESPNTCTLSTSTAATLTIAVVNGPTATYADSSFSLWTSADGTASRPPAGETISAAVPATGTSWAATLGSSGGEAHATAAPTAPASPTGAMPGGFLCASASSEQVDLSWNAVPDATSYVVEQSSTATGTYAVASPAPVYSGTSATITYTTAVTEYYKVKAYVGTNWVSAVSAVFVNGGVTSGFVVTSTTAPECTDS